MRTSLTTLVDIAELLIAGFIGWIVREVLGYAKNLILKTLKFEGVFHFHSLKNRFIVIFALLLSQFCYKPTTVLFNPRVWKRCLNGYIEHGSLAIPVFKYPSRRYIFAVTAYE